MKAFVTGATGFIGGRLLRELLAHGYEVRALVRTFDRARALPDGVRVVPGDVTKPETLRPGARGADIVFHLAAWRPTRLRPKDLPRLDRINVDGARAALEVAGELGVPRVVYTSLATLYDCAPGRPIDESCPLRSGPFANEYQRSKHRALVEVVQPLAAQGLPVIVTCPTLVYGPGDTGPMAGLLRAYARRRLPAMIGAESAYNWTYVDDAAAGHRLAAEQGRPGQAYLLAGPALNLRQLLAAAERATGLPAPRAWLPARLATVLADALAQVSPRSAALLRGLSGEGRLASAEKARRELGWQARPPEAGLRETVAWLRAQDERGKE